MQKEEQEFKSKGVNFYLYYWTIIVFVGFLFIKKIFENYPIKVAVDELSLIISVVSFLFGFIISISFSLILSKNSALKESLAIETARLVSLFHLSKNLGKEFHERVKQNIDNYTVNTLRDYTNYEVGRESIYSMYNDLNYVENKTDFQKQAFDSFLYILGELESTREKLEYLTKGGLILALKFTNYLLGVILIGLLFLNRGSIFNDWLFVILSTVIIFLLLIIEDYENLKIGDYNINISNSEQLFDLIGTNRYYPEEILGRVKLEKGKTYRVGKYDPVEKRQKIISMKYTPRKRIK